ncbi:hypothetical protein DFH09DRAFT_1195779 [Mycena vulgaris]|nr:hypothetical protein DFH09DRAFT_1195779 [Mycena vulgaris]
MHRSSFRPISPKELRLDSALFTPLKRGDESTETVLNSSTTLLRPSVSDESQTYSFKAPHALSLLLHCTLVGVHLALIAVWARGLEHELVYPLEHQQIVSFLVTAISTTAGTIYSALLVLVTQNASRGRNLYRDQSLTATHDTEAAWAGVGSAVVQLWNQKTIPACIVGVLSVFLYLGNILVLHVTTPALFSLEAFNSSRSISVGTQGLPVWNSSNQGGEDHAKMGFFAGAALYYIPFIDGILPIGLKDGTIHDVLDVNAGVDNVNVNATGFNITCGYLVDVDLKFLAARNAWRLAVPYFPWTNRTFVLPSTQPGVIYTIADSGNSILLYSTVPIVDSSFSRGSWVNFPSPTNASKSSVPSIQVFRCSQSRVEQTALVDPQSGTPIKITPEINKTTSTWQPTPERITEWQDPLLDVWGTWYSWMPPSDFPLRVNPDNSLQTDYFSVADLYLLRKLNLRPPKARDAPKTVTLHDLENTLSSLVASMFWTLGHIHPTHSTYMYDVNLRTGVIEASIGEFWSPLHLRQGNITVTEIATQARLDLNIIAAGAGLAASTALALLSAFYFRPLRAPSGSSAVVTDDTGILHAIWLYRNHPELETLLQQVEHPTSENLRRAGMIRTTLLAASVDQQGCKSF